MTAMVGTRADRLTKSLNNPLSGRVTFLAIVLHPGIHTGDKINR
jgi:hypothetical protein